MTTSRRSSITAFTILLLFLNVGLIGMVNPVSASISPPRGVGTGSWNPVVPCSSPWILRISDITDNMTGSNSFGNSTFSPGITDNVQFSQGAKRWLTPGATPPGWQGPGPSCTITNQKGQTVASFVEIDGVATGFPNYLDCSTDYDPANGGSAMPTGHWCDNFFNIFDPALVPNYSTSCTSPTDPTCYGRMHVEFDRDWMAAGYCGPSTSTCNNSTLVPLMHPGSSSTLFDLQGFIFWDPGHPTEQWHSFSGWELHALTAWRVHQSSPSAPDFALIISSPSISTNQGATATTTVTVLSQNKFSGTINLSTSVSPSGPTVLLNPTSLKLSSGGSPKSTLSFQSSTVGNYTVTVTGTNGTLTHKISIPVTVNPAPDFLITPNPNILIEAPGASTSAAITLNSLNGFNGQVSLQASVSAGGFGIQINPNNPTLTPGGNSTSTLTVTAPNNAIANNYTITLTGKSGPITHTLTIPLVIPGFAMAINPGDLAFAAGGSGLFNITLASLNGFNGTVTLAVQVNNQNLQATLGSTTIQVSPGGTIVTPLTVSSSANGGYQVTVTASFGKLQTKVSANVDVTSGPDFTISANPIFLSITTGSSGTATITGSSINGLIGNLNLKATSNPHGPIVSLNPTSIIVVPLIPSTSTLTISVPRSAPVGLYSIVVTGTSGPSHTVTLSLYVTNPFPDFSLSSNPDSQTVNAGNSASYILTLASVNQFSGTITLSTNSQSGLIFSLNPASVSLSSAASATSNLTITTSRSTTPSTYNVTVTATSGSLVHTMIVTILVIGPLDFALTGLPATITILAGTPGNATIGLNNMNGFSGTVNLAISVTPSPGLTCTNSPTTITGSQTSTLSCTGSAGSYTVTVTGTSGNLSHSNSTTIIVQDFTISANPGTLSTAPNQSANSAIVVNPLQGFSGTVTLASNSTACTLAPNSVNGSGSATLSCTFTSNGIIHVTVTGTSESLSHSTIVTYGVGVTLPPDFQISINPASINLYPSTSNMSTVSIASINGFTGNVALSAIVPSGFAVTFGTNPVAAGSTSTLSVQAAASITAGTYNVTVTGTSGNLTHSVNLSVTVLNPPRVAFVATVPITGSSGTTATTSTLPFVKGDLIVVFVSVGAGQTVTSITDSGGPSSTYTQQASAANGNTITYLYTATAATSTNNTITVKTSASGSFAIDAAEYSGVVGFGASNSNTGTSTTPSVTLTTQNSNSMVIVAYGFTGSAGHSGDTGFQDRHAGSSGIQHLDWGDSASKPAGTYTFSATLTVANPWAMIALEIV